MCSSGQYDVLQSSTLTTTQAAAACRGDITDSKHYCCYHQNAIAVHLLEMMLTNLQGEYSETVSEAAYAGQIYRVA
ncbi:uncharacterized protein PHALS_04413 [Plasmopara halstedii]|uniref:Uncharacterized protein n=1 Tax=Plasmopara halstedii TaxID=4781 RepID=A0A0P1AZN8_PLAHL|nr:uncharacterized protein PHALS_04413 [Plasmopara halstedii]CEG47545.1 hypothetical protein PHALS_04413 [Plasmopara halstedii]|eukprot:XP_024583914.1 hypothetical protein PHALS_04413 [Plasmopara halstedii]